jgi:hypothetical protein
LCSAGRLLLLLSCLLGTVGCSTTAALHNIIGEAYPDRIGRIEHAWIGADELRVLARGSFGNAITNSEVTLRYGSLSGGPTLKHRADTAKHPVLLARSQIVKGWIEPTIGEGFSELDIRSRTLTNHYEKARIFELADGSAAEPFVLTDSAMLRVPSDPTGASKDYSWFAFSAAHQYHKEKLYQIPLAVVSDAAMTVIGLFAAYGGANLMQNYDPRDDFSEQPSAQMIQAMLSEDREKASAEKPPVLSRIHIGDGATGMHPTLTSANSDPRFRPCDCPP